MSVARWATIHCLQVHQHSTVAVSSLHELICTKSALLGYYRIAGIFRGMYISRISQKGPSSLTLKPGNLIIESGCGQLECNAADTTLL